jgi:hypothetical protein
MGGGELAAKVTPLSNAQYRLTYKANLQGSYSLGVYVGTDAIAGTPAKCEVKAGQVDVAASRLYGPGLERIQVCERVHSSSTVCPLPYTVICSPRLRERCQRRFRRPSS